MLSELNSEMRKHKLEGIMVLGESTVGNPELFYVTRTHLVRGGVYIKKIDEDPCLIVDPTDITSAKEGLVKNIKTFSDYGMEKIFSKYPPEKARVILFDKIIRSHKITGRIGIFGRVNVSRVVNLVDQLRRLGHRIIGEKRSPLLDVLRETKDSHEIENIKNVGLKTENVIKRTIDFLKKCKIVNRRLRFKNRKLTVKDVKRIIRTYLAEENLVASEGIIFAPGPNSANPHYMGQDSDLVTANQPIIIDIFPQEIGGYCFDMTRTIVIGRAPPEIKRMHEAVLEAQEVAFDNLREGIQAEYIMHLVCDHFEKRGYKTMRDLLKGDKSAAIEGFTHPLGHGVGLATGESPAIGFFAKKKLRTGHVLAIEPALYKPGLGGVRVEDIVAIKGDKIELLSNMDKSLEIC